MKNLITFLGITGITLIALKLTNNIELEWIIVLLPLWILLGIGLLTFVWLIIISIRELGD